MDGERDGREWRDRRDVSFEVPGSKFEVFGPSNFELRMDRDRT